jgi:hypothetical protein
MISTGPKAARSPAQGRALVIVDLRHATHAAGLCVPW